MNGKWFAIVDLRMIERDDENHCVWNVVKTLLAKKCRMKQSMEKQDNLRLINGFLARSR